MKRTQYFTRPGGKGVCLWRVSGKCKIKYFGNPTQMWHDSKASLDNLTNTVNIIKVSRDQARKWYPAAFRQPFIA